METGNIVLPWTCVNVNKLLMVLMGSNIICVWAVFLSFDVLAGVYNNNNDDNNDNNNANNDNNMPMIRIRITLTTTIIVIIIITRYVDGTPMSEVTQSLSGTSVHPTMVTLVNIMVMNWWPTSFSSHVNQPAHSWDKANSDSDLEISTPMSRSWVWSKGNVIQSAQYHINSLRFHFTSIPEIELFRNLTLKHKKSRSWVSSTYCTQYPTDALPFRFISVGPTIHEIWPK